MNNTAQPLLISLKPDYADLVFRGLKTAELRRRLSEHIVDRDVFVYVSSPIKELRGGFRVGQVWSGSPEQIWATVSRLAGVSREVFDNYYYGTNVAFAIEILDVWQYANPRSLDNLRSQFPGFVVPQSYRYVKANEARSFRNLKRVIKTIHTSLAA
jgi:predicted transcriptional regulator